MKDFCFTQKEHHPLREISFRNYSKNKTINKTNTNASYRRLDNIKDYVKSQCKLIKRPDTILLFSNFLSSKSKDSQPDASISRNNSSVFSYYNQNLSHPQESYRTLTNYNNKLPPYFSSSQISKEKSNITSNNKGSSSIELLSMNMIINTLKKERGSYNDLKQTEADSSLDQKISFVNKKSSNRNPFYLHYINDSKKGISNPKYNIAKSKFSNIPENKLNNSQSLMTIKRKKTNYLTQQSTLNKKRSIKLFLKKNREITSNYNDKNEYYNIDISRNVIKSKYQNSNKNSFDEYYNSLDSSNAIFRPKTSRSIKNLFIECCNTNEDNNKTRPMIQIISNNNITWIKENIRPVSLKLVKLIDKECISQIESKCKLRKSEKIKLVLHSIEKKTNKPIPQLQIKQVPLLTGSFFQTSAWNDKSKHFNVDLIATAMNKSYYLMKMRPKYEYNFDVKIHSSLTKMLIEKYDDLMYCLILKNYFPKNIQVHPKIRFNIEQSPNKQYTINLLKADFIVKSNTKNDDDTSNISKISRKGRKTFNTVISTFNPIFKKMILYTSSLSLNAKQSRYFHKIVVKENNLRRKKSITILPRKLYSRKGFDVTKYEYLILHYSLKKLANKMNLSVNIKRKGKNIDFHLINEQEEMKKNRNMSKESLVFRTQEIKMKMKDKLKTIEEIIFFLIQELNIKEIKNLIEQYQLPLEARDNNGNTYLIVAVQCCFIECILYLLHKGADINAQNYELNTPLHMALLYQNFTIVDILLKHEADETILNKYNFTPWEFLHLDKKY